MRKEQRIFLYDWIAGSCKVMLGAPGYAEYTVDADVLTLEEDGKQVRLIPVIPGVTLIRATPGMEHVMATAGKLCYSRSSIQQVVTGLSHAESRRFLSEQIVPAGHHSVIEHALFTFGVEGISRACANQLVRHRHMSFDQQSQRYVDFWKYKQPVFEFIVPPAMSRSKEVFMQYVEHIKNGLRAYIWAKQNGASGEDARMFLMNAAATKLIVSANPRALYEFLTKRTCALAQWEIDIIATEMAELAYLEAPSIFESAGPGCARGKCPEGKRCCLITIKPLHTYTNETVYPHDNWNGRTLGDLTPEERAVAARNMRQQHAKAKRKAGETDDNGDA